MQVTASGTGSAFWPPPFIKAPILTAGPRASGKGCAVKVKLMTGFGTIEFPCGARHTLQYALSDRNSDGAIHGMLLADLMALHPEPIAQQLRLTCADGATLRLLITHRTTRGSTFIAAAV
ncbi:hypothetical protein OIU35_12340 [Boseaceae bacterium BT-24-1]|nr:hypothetical protein [Boseaceae bacterium BT-24-1]